MPGKEGEAGYVPYAGCTCHAGYTRLHSAHSVHGMHMHTPCTATHTSCHTPCTCHAHAMPHAMHTPCTCHAYTMHTPCTCHAHVMPHAMHTPCTCHAHAMHMHALERVDAGRCVAALGRHWAHVAARSHGHLYDGGTVGVADGALDAGRCGGGEGGCPRGGAASLASWLEERGVALTRCRLEVGRGAIAAG